MSVQSFTVIGISDSRNQFFPPQIMSVISGSKVFSGGKRHYEIMKPFLPEDSVWIDIVVPLDKVFDSYRQYTDLVVFASGDPLFFGFANTLKSRLPQASIKVFPSFNSLQMLAHRLELPYQDMHMVSLTGRPWDAFDEALINQEKMMGVLTDRNNTPSVIASRMRDYGYDNYIMYVGESLGNDEAERVRSFTIEEAAETSDFKFPNCIILQRTSRKDRFFGIPESEFHLLNGRTKMITKMPIRLLSLSMLDLHNRSSLWDIGFCTGSISVEAKLQFPHLKVTSFEVRPEGEELMRLNSRKFGTPGINVHIGDFMQADLDKFPVPDAVFIGGHNGQLKDIMRKVKSVMSPGGVIVFNSVSEESLRLFREGASELGMEIVSSVHLAVDSFNPIEILKAQ